MKNNNSFTKYLFHTYCVSAPLSSWSTQVSSWRDIENVCKHNYDGAEACTLVWKGLGGPQSHL